MLPSHPRYKKGQFLDRLESEKMPEVAEEKRLKKGVKRFGEADRMATFALRFKKRKFLYK